jgi:hypothetical protein
VSEQRLNHANVGAALEQMGREAMPERVERESALRNPPSLTASLNSRLN